MFNFLMLISFNNVIITHSYHHCQVALQIFANSGLCLQILSIMDTAVATELPLQTFDLALIIVFYSNM